MQPYQNIVNKLYFLRHICCRCSEVPVSSQAQATLKNELTLAVSHFSPQVLHQVKSGLLRAKLSMARSPIVIREENKKDKLWSKSA